MGLLDIGLRTSVVVLVALAASASLRRHSAALRHCILAGGLILSAAVLPFSLTLPSWDLPVQRRPPVELAATSVDDSGSTTGAAAQTPVAVERVSVEQLVAVVWGIGFGVSATLLLVGFTRLARVTRRATPVSSPRWLALNQQLAARYGLRGRVALLKTDVPDVLATWGILRPCVLLPTHCESWTDARVHVVLAHELAHIRRADWCVQVAAEAICTVFWFNPLFWIACTRLRRESEQASDDAVLDAGVPAAEYASHLVEIARICRPSSPNWASAMPIARPSTLERRITAMLNTTLSRRRPTRRTLAIALAALLGITVPTATFRASAQSGPLPLAGSVYDMSGAVLPQVVLTLEDAQGVKRGATTDGSGRFEFEPVGPGRYVLETALAGFLRLRHEFALRDARDWERAITLQVGTIQETIVVRAQRPSGSGSTAGVPNGPVRVGGNIRAPRKLHDVKPIYPPAMRDAGLEGLVPIEALIGIDGRVASVRVISAQVHPEFAKAAVDAVRQWQFSPTLLNGVAVEVLMTVTVQFSLSD